MKNPRKMTAFSDMLLKLRFAEKHAFRFFGTKCRL
jgi:hypothetical protein